MIIEGNFIHIQDNLGLAITIDFSNLRKTTVSTAEDSSYLNFYYTDTEYPDFWIVYSTAEEAEKVNVQLHKGILETRERLEE